MHIAPQDRRILIYAKLISDRAENAFQGWVFAHWDPETSWWRLSPHVEGTKIDNAEGWMPVSIIDGRSGQPPENA